MNDSLLTELPVLVDDDGKITQPLKVGNGIFRPGVQATTVLLAASRQYAYYRESAENEEPRDGESVLDATLKSIERAKQLRAALMPTESDAFTEMFEAYQRLQELGWKDATYAPKGVGTDFQSYWPGSTAKAERTTRDAEGRFWVFESEDMWPAHPAMYKEKDEGS